MLVNLRLTSVDLVCAYEFGDFFKKLFVRASYCLYLCSIPIEIGFRAKTQQLGFLKIQFFARLRHLRSTWDLRIRAF